MAAVIRSLGKPVVTERMGRWEGESGLKGEEETFGAEANLFDSCRHHIASSGAPGAAYEAGYNFCGPNANGHLFDMHGGRDGTVREWDVAAGREASTNLAHRRQEAVAFAGDGRICAAGRKGEVVVWDRATGQEIGRLSGHEGPVHALAVAPDGTTLVSGSADSTALVWRLAG